MSEAVIGLIGVIVGAAITVGFESWKDWRARKRNARYLAIRLVSFIDRYVQGCVEVTGDSGSPMESDEDYHPEDYSPAEYPVFDVHSLDVDWKSIDPNLMYDVLSFPNQIDAANRIIAEEARCNPAEIEINLERRYQYTILGLTISKVADKLRREYQIPQRDTEAYNPI